MIKPTIGRRVWFFPNVENPRASMNVYDATTPCDAGVVFVHNDRLVNLDVCDHGDTHWPEPSVPLLQDDDVPPPLGRAYAVWMPYQTGQAKAAA